MDITAPAGQAIAANLVAHGAQADAQQFGGARAVAARGLEGHLDQLAFHLSQRDPRRTDACRRGSLRLAVPQPIPSPRALRRQSRCRWPSATARRRQLASSRTLPGQAWASSRSIQKLRSQPQGFARRRVQSRTKYSASSRMSPARSRSGGRLRGITFRR